MSRAMGAPVIAAPRAGRWPMFGWFAFLFLIASQAIAIATSPPDRDMGDLQKIMYVHVPAAWMTMLAPLTVLVFALRYLWKRREEDDLLAAAAAEVGDIRRAYSGAWHAVGAAHVGRVVDLGRAPHVHAGAVPHPGRLPR